MLNTLFSPNNVSRIRIIKQMITSRLQVTGTVILMCYIRGNVEMLSVIWLIIVLLKQQIH